MNIKQFIKENFIPLIVVIVAIGFSIFYVTYHIVLIRNLEKKSEQIIEESKSYFDDLKEKMIEEYKKSLIKDEL